MRCVNLGFLGNEMFVSVRFSGNTLVIHNIPSIDYKNALLYQTHLARNMSLYLFSLFTPADTK